MSIEDKDTYHQWRPIKTPNEPLGKHNYNTPYSIIDEPEQLQRNDQEQHVKQYRRSKFKQTKGITKLLHHFITIQVVTMFS